MATETTPVSTWHFHVVYVVIIALVLIAGRVWLTEHDARVAAETSIKVSEAQVKDLQGQIAALRTQAAQKVIVIQKEAAAIKTTPQAAPIIQAFDPRLNVRTLPTFPDDVQVAAIPLALDVEQFKIAQINLDACTLELTKETQIASAKTSEVTALKKKPAFWKRFKRTVEYGAVC